MRNIKLPSALSGYVPEIQDVVDTMPKGKAYPWSMRKSDDIDCIIIHHFASESSLLANANYHINGRGWKSLGYHVVIDNGFIKQTNNLLHRTNHCSGYNDRSIGVSIRGDLSKRVLTELERKLLYAAIVTLKLLFPNAVVKAHSECTKTSCPCTDINVIRNGVSSLEEQISYISTPTAERVLAYAFADRMTDLGNKLADPKHGAEANRKILLLEPVLNQIGYSGEVTAFKIVQRIVDLYNNSKIAKNEEGGFKKLIIGANKAKEMGLL